VRVCACRGGGERERTVGRRREPRKPVICEMPDVFLFCAVVCRRSDRGVLQQPQGKPCTQKQTNNNKKKRWAKTKGQENNCSGMGVATVTMGEGGRGGDTRPRSDSATRHTRKCTCTHRRTSRNRPPGLSPHHRNVVPPRPVDVPQSVCVWVGAVATSPIITKKYADPALPLKNPTLAGVRREERTTGRTLIKRL
jgi:hypothetical protein